jgi:hypothetical protein
MTSNSVVPVVQWHHKSISAKKVAIVKNAKERVGYATN